MRRASEQLTVCAIVAGAVFVTCKRASAMPYGSSTRCVYRNEPVPWTSFPSAPTSSHAYARFPIPAKPSLLTAQKLLRAAQVLCVPVFVTTQNRARLGDTVPELRSCLADAGDLVRLNADKTGFSMWSGVDALAEHPHFTDAGPASAVVAIVGIESHICVTQTALDLARAGHRVYVLADGVSSCNREEVPVALDRLRNAAAEIATAAVPGASSAGSITVTTSESWLYECVGDAATPEFRQILGLVKDTAANTGAALQGLLPARM